MNRKINGLSNRINDPFKGKKGFMPEKIKEKIIIRSGLNENLVFPEKKMKELMKIVAEKIDPRIYPEDYSDSLCNVIAKEYNLDYNQIAVGNGGDKVIDLMVRLTIKSGFNAVIINPTYPMFEHAVKVQGGGMTEFLLSSAPEFDINPDYILNNISPNDDRVLFLCSPNNPTGNQFEINKIKKIINEFPGIVALDETYSDFGNYSMVSYLEEFPNLIIMKSFSKFYALAGMRIGFAFADKMLIDRIKELQPAFNVNIASIELAKLVMQEKIILKQMLYDILSGREYLFNELSKIPEITPYKSFTNFILFKIDEVKADNIQMILLKEYGILVRNMSAMPLCENSLRVSVTTHENNEKFIKALVNIMKKN
ncbi:MAG: aminotransferase class I/II-fold pyridoxal phosphate-dependent enzyme [Asgard group archaeon]|nr:aminotransferase class I/II-fold pyridoxal phosphate-dependent enzyme [Asgard group archaeon]